MLPQQNDFTIKVADFVLMEASFRSLIVVIIGLALMCALIWLWKRKV